MSGWLVHLDNHSLGHADAAADSVRARGLRTAAIGPAAEIATLRTVERAIPLDRCDASAVEAALATLEAEAPIRGIRCMFGLPEGGGAEPRSLTALAAEARARRGLPGPTAAALDSANVKSLTRRVLDRAGIANVAHRLVRSGDEAADFVRACGRAIILKPLTGVGAGFVRRCDGADDARTGFDEIVPLLAHAYHRPTRNPPFIAHTPWGDVPVDPRATLLAEEHIDGPEISVECVVVGNQPLPLVVNDKLALETTRWTVREPLLVTPPIRLDRRQTAAARDYAVRVIEALGLSDCVCHVELRIDAARGPLLLEVNPRIGAGCVRDSLATFWGVDPIAVDVDLALGRVPPMSRFERTDRAHAMIFLFTDRQGILRGIDGLETMMRQPGVLCVRQMTDTGAAVDGRHEEQFLLGVWRRLTEGQTPQAAYRATLEAINVDIL
ncbi:ATP-grasp domain-containing protein [Sphingomonas sp. M1-B02]|uniref:ATP-grasp domain-containing protein n=1 Tax=Sphingomonas sp. M1-B02 TaxID=3114300 RepID=UPI0022409F60|nr:ATP-grasp domain-containing protein [Sphingomonas sp. S6-11]UZK65876.1 ATP-grasp domain-containing protein [Sphingomonas sp. S6-11]